MKTNKQKISILGLMFSCLFGYSQSISNGDFELWNTNTVDTLVSWKGTLGLQKVDGNSSNHAVRIETFNTGDKAGLLMGSVSCLTSCNGTITGSGLPISNIGNQTFSLKFDYKTSNTSGAIPSVAMGFIDANGELIGGSDGYYFSSLQNSTSFTSANVTQFIVTSPNFSIVSKVPSAAKQAILAFFADLPINTPIAGSYLEVDNVSLTIGGTSISIPNNGFEQWNSITTNLPQVWQNSESYLKGSVQKVQSNTGFAAQITTGNLLGIITSGVINLGSISYDDNYVETGYYPVFKVDKTPSKFKFNYQYTPVQNDSASVLVVLTKNKNGVTTKVGQGYEYLPSNVNFENFSLNISMLNGETKADSAIIYFNSSRGSMDYPNRFEGSTLKIDNVVFDYTATNDIEDNLISCCNIKNINSSLEIINTSTSNLKIFIYNLDGQTIFSKSINPSEKIEKLILKSGVYVIKAVSDIFIQTEKVFVK